MLRTATGELPATQDGRTRSVVSVYVPEKRAAAVVAVVARQLAIVRRNGLLRAATLRQGRVADRDWAESWKARFRPRRIARGIYIVPSWERGFRPPSGSSAIVLDPKMAFGTGLHPTTRGAISLALACMRSTVIDVGCGSGIIGIAAAQHGARVYACDNDPVAVAAARANFRANRLRAAEIALSDGPPRTFPEASLIVANIDAETLAGMARKLDAHLAPGGSLVSSGIAGTGRSKLLAALSALGLRKAAERRSGEWFSFVHRKDARHA